MKSILTPPHRTQRWARDLPLQRLRRQPRRHPIQRLTSIGVTFVYALVEGEYVPYILGAPEFATARFRALFPDGAPAATPFTVRPE